MHLLNLLRTWIPDQATRRLSGMTVSFILVFSLILGCTGLTTTVSQTSVEPPPPADVTGIVQTLLDLLKNQDKVNPVGEDYESTSLDHIRTLRTPAGYRLYLRYSKYGISLVEALKLAKDRQLKERLLEMVRWSRRPEVRAEALLTLAGFSDPAHKKYFKEAALDNKNGIRFAAIESHQIWNQPESLQLLTLIKDRDWSPLMQVFAAQALLSLGEQSALQTLWKGLDSNSWIIRAMSARYLGDYASPNDYEKLFTYFKRENRNGFVLAELAIASLKLISQRDDKVPYSPFSKGWRDHEEVKYTIGKRGVVELEPLVIVPPRLRIPKSLQVATQINNELLRLIRERLDVPLDPLQASDVIYEELDDFLTPTALALYFRYSSLSYLVAEGLAGANDLRIRAELENLAVRDSRPVVRATALLSLAYNRDPRDIFLIQEALKDKSSIVRMGAMEAIEVGRFKEALPSLNSIVSNDPVPALQLYGLQVMARSGDAGVRFLLINQLSNPDWPARAMAFWYLGRYGDPADYTLVLSKLNFETNPFVQTEIALAGLRLAPL